MQLTAKGLAPHAAGPVEEDGTDEPKGVRIRIERGSIGLNVESHHQHGFEARCDAEGEHQRQIGRGISAPRPAVVLAAQHRVSRSRDSGTGTSTARAARTRGSYSWQRYRPECAPCADRRGSARRRWPCADAVDASRFGSRLNVTTLDGPIIDTRTLETAGRGGKFLNRLGEGIAVAQLAARRQCA